MVPLHSYKHIAELQHTLGSSGTQHNPLLIRIEVRACCVCVRGDERLAAGDAGVPRGGGGGRLTGCQQPAGLDRRPWDPTSIQVRAGHGAGKPTAKIIDETADMFGG